MEEMIKFKKRKCYKRSDLVKNVSPFFHQSIIYDYCYLIDLKEEKGYRTDDLREDLLRLINKMEIEKLSAKQRKAISHIHKSIRTNKC